MGGVSDTSPAGRRRDGGAADGEGGSGREPAGRLRVPGSAWETVAAGLEEAYPGEGCGVLLGSASGAERRVEAAKPSGNRRGERDDRYGVDPDLLRRLQAREEEGGPRVLGFYHSHPDAAPVPSETDRAWAWPWYVYLIVPVEAGRARPEEARAWRLQGDEFAEVNLAGSQVYRRS